MRFFRSIPTILFLLFLQAAPPLTSQIQIELMSESPRVGNNCTLLHVGESNGPLYEALRTLVRSDEMAEMRIIFFSVQPDSVNHVMFAESGLMRDSAWALALWDGRKRTLLLQGTKPPTITEIQNALNRAGVKSPISVLRDFLRSHPDHLDARMQLLSHLRPIAEQRTRDALRLDIKTAGDLSYEDHTKMGDSVSIVADTSAMGDKQLGPEQDRTIWGVYAQELQTLFNSGDWRLASLPWTQYQIPLDACSPTMVQIYRRHIPRIEASLGEYPSNTNLWRLYGYMASIAKQNSVRALLDGLAPSPETYYADWAEVKALALSLLIPEERAKENWGFIAETLMQDWPDRRIFLMQKTHFGAAKESYAMVAKSILDAAWSDSVRPLLESLIKTNRDADTETIVMDIARVKPYGYVHPLPIYRDIQRMAADLAKSIGRQDLQTKWLAFQIPEKNGPDIDDLYFAAGDLPLSPCLVIINAEESHNPVIDEMLNNSRILDWRVSRAYLQKDLSEFLQKKEGWLEGETHWALFHNDKIIAHGPGLPAVGDLAQGLELSGVQTPANILRRFVSANPTHYEAKENLLWELKRLAEQKVRDKLGEAAGKDDAMLSEQDDQAIWGEYALLYRQMLPYYLEQARPPLPSWLYSLVSSPCYSAFFIHSQTMKTLSYRFLPQVEACLKRQPSDSFLWDAWATLSYLGESRNIKGLLDSLEFSPLATPFEKLPPNARKIVADYRAMSNWQGVADLLERLLDALRSSPYELPNTLPAGYTPEFSPTLWSQRDTQYLVEAWLRLEKVREANEFIRLWSQSPEWREIKQSAVELAKKCGKDALAEQWGKL